MAVESVAVEPEYQVQVNPAALSPHIEKAISRRVAASLPMQMDGRNIKLNFETVDTAIGNELKRNPLTQDMPQMSGEQLADLRNKIKSEYGNISAPLGYDSSAPAVAPENAKYRYAMVPPDKMAGAGVDPQGRLNTHAKWNSLKNTIESSGGAVDVMPSNADKGSVQEMYSRDSYFMLGNKAYLPDVDKLDSLNGGPNDQTRDDINQMKSFLESKGVETVKVDGAWFEGGNLVKNSTSNTVFMGLETEKWDNSESMKKLGEKINETQSEKWSMHGVPLTNEKEMFHLDLGMSQELPNGEHVISPHVTDRATIEGIQKKIGPDKAIMLTNPEDSYNAAPNLAVASDKNLVMSSASPELKGALNKRGYNVLTAEDVGQRDFMTASGGPDCQTNGLPARQSSPPPAP